MERKIDIKFQLKKIELVEFSLNTPKSGAKPEKTFHYNLNMEHRIVPENKLLINMIKIMLYGEDEEILLGSLKVGISFEIDNFNDFLDNGKNRVLIPDEMLSVFNSISISTARGVMFSQFRGTHLHNAVLPIIDPKSFKKE